MTQTADTLNGFPIIHSAPFDKKPMTRKGRVIIADRGAGTFQRYVSAVHFEADSEWWKGFYTDDLDEAKEDAAALHRRFA